ncbi:hypothetical protein G9A89_017930 [Geosiphon pyriformis]|nr:hypothetical protein G9A89_017930 [Geosiphon pyriformis]
MNLNILRNARCRRDQKARKTVAATEPLRNVYRYLLRNETLPSRIRQQAQLALNAFPRYARPTTVKNRCIETGRGRGVFREYKLCRFRFRLNALAGELPGVKKACW